MREEFSNEKKIGPKTPGELAEGKGIKMSGMNEEQQEEHDRLNENDPLKNYIPIEDVADPSNEYEAFGEGEENEPETDIEDMEMHEAEARTKDREADYFAEEEVERIQRELQEMSGSDRSDSLDTSHEATNDDNSDNLPHREEMSRRLKGGGFWESKPGRTYGFKRYGTRKMEKKKEAYRAAQNVATPDPGFFGKLKNMLSGNDEDQNKAA